MRGAIIMLDNFFNTQEVAEILEIHEVSAKELMDGKIEFESDELYALAKYKGTTVQKLILAMNNECKA